MFTDKIFIPFFYVEGKCKNLNQKAKRIKTNFKHILINLSLFATFVANLSSSVWCR